MIRIENVIRKMAGMNNLDLSGVEYRLMAGMSTPAERESRIKALLPPVVVVPVMPPPAPPRPDWMEELEEVLKPTPGSSGMTVEEFASKSGYKLGANPKIGPVPKHLVDKASLGDKATMVKYLPILRKKKVVKSIIRYLEGYAAWVCGGFARYVVSPCIKPAKTDDIDIYCESEAVYNALKQKFTDDGFVQKYDNPVAVCFNPKNILPRPPFAKYMVNLIKPVVDGRIMTKGTPQEIISNFDFSVTRVALVDGKNALADSNFEQDEIGGFLRIGNIHCPISSSLRVAKYYRKGYYTKPTEIVKLFRDWDGRGPEYKTKLLDMIDMLEKTRDLNPNEVEAIMGSGKRKSKKEIADALYEMMRVD